MALCSAVPAIETADILHRLGLTPTMREEILSLRESVRMTLVELINWHRDTQKKGQAEQSVSRLCALLAPRPSESTLYLMARSDNEEINSSVSQYIYKWRQIKVDINGRRPAPASAWSPGRSSQRDAHGPRRKAGREGRNERRRS